MGGSCSHTDTVARPLPYTTSPSRTVVRQPTPAASAPRPAEYYVSLAVKKGEDRSARSHDQKTQSPPPQKKIYKPPEVISPRYSVPANLHVQHTASGEWPY